MMDGYKKRRVSAGGIAALEFSIFLMIMIPLIVSIIGFVEYLSISDKLRHWANDAVTDSKIKTARLFTGDQDTWVGVFERPGNGTASDLGNDTYFTQRMEHKLNKGLSRIKAAVLSDIANCSSPDSCLDKVRIELRNLNLELEQERGFVERVVHPNSFDKTTDSRPEVWVQGNLQAPTYITQLRDSMLNAIESYRIENSPTTALPYAIPSGLFGVTPQQYHGTTGLRPGGNSTTNTTLMANYLRHVKILGASVTVDLSGTLTGNFIKYAFGINPPILYQQAVAPVRTTF